jgi:hypothetical protein
VGALAFLASAGLAIVLGAGLHVWSGPSAANGAAGNGLAPSVTGGVGGVVTVTAPPAAQHQPPTTTTTGPAVALPFVPFVPAAPAPPAVVTPRGGAASAGTGDVRDVPVGLRLLLSQLRSARITTGGSEELRPATHVRATVRGTSTHDASRGRAHGREHARPSHRPLPHGVTVGEDNPQPHRSGRHAQVRAHDRHEHDGRAHGHHRLHHHGHGHGLGHRHD